MCKSQTEYQLNMFKITMANIALTFCQYSSLNEIKILIWHQVMKLEFIILRLHLPIKNVFTPLLLCERLTRRTLKSNNTAEMLGGCS